MRLGVLVAILGEMPPYKDNVCVGAEKIVHHREKPQATSHQQPSTPPRVRLTLSRNG